MRKRPDAPEPHHHPNLSHLSPLVYPRSIVSLRAAHPGAPPPALDELRGKLAAGRVAETVDRSLPGVEAQLLRLRNQIQEVNQEVYAEVWECEECLFAS